jgi:hypothetical protein
MKCRNLRRLSAGFLKNGIFPRSVFAPDPSGTGSAVVVFGQTYLTDGYAIIEGSVNRAPCVSFAAIKICCQV